MANETATGGTPAPDGANAKVEPELHRPEPHLSELRRPELHRPEPRQPELYRFAPHERPLLPGSPATPDHPARRRIAYFAIGTLLGLTGGFINALLSANLPQIQGALGLTSVEGGWLTAVYSMTSVCMSLLLIKFRQQFGMQRFTRVVLVGFVALNFAQLFVHSYGTELVVRGAGGIVASGLSTLCLFYMMQAMPPAARLGGFVLGVGWGQVALPLARVISPLLLVDGDIQNLFLFEAGLTLVCLASVMLLRLPPAETIPAFEPLDFLTFALFAPGMALLCAVLAQGRIEWWTTPWLGYALATAIPLIAAALVIEHNRANPLLNTRWMGTGGVLRFAAVAAIMRILLNEQNYGTTGLLTALGLVPDQLVVLYAIVTLATVAGMFLSLKALDPAKILRPLMISGVLIAIAAFIDASATNLTRPSQLYVTQGMIAFAAVYFLGPTMISGIIQALAKGPSHIVSFSAVFGISQTLGGLGGAALLGSFQVMRERLHSSNLVAGVITTDPQVALRLQQLGGAYARVVTDPAQRQTIGVQLLGQQITREANILAFNDVFLLIGVLALIGLLLLAQRWNYYRRNRITPFADEMAALAAMREKAAAS